MMDERNNNGAKRRLLISRDCPFCETVKEMLSKEISRGEIETIDIDQDRDAKFLAGRFGGVPTLIEEKNGRIYELKLED